MEKVKKVRLILKAYHSGNHVFIEIEDDGAGISREKVLKKALKSELLLRKWLQYFQINKCMN